jgi:hypothetical protein
MIVAKVVSDPEPLAHLRPDLPPALCDVVMRSLSKEPLDRFESVSAFRAALRPFYDLEEPDAPVIRISQTASAPVPEAAKQVIADAANDKREAGHVEVDASSAERAERAGPETARRARALPVILGLVALSAIAAVVATSAIVSPDASDEARPVTSAPSAPPTVTPIHHEPAVEEEEAESHLATTPVRFDTSPAGASVSIDGEPSCEETPCTVELGDEGAVAVIERRGYRPETVALTAPLREVVRVELTAIPQRPTMDQSAMTTSTMMGSGLPFDMM